MRNLAIIIVAVLLAGSLSAQDVEKTLIKPVNLQGKTILEVNLNGTVDVRPWSNEYAKVEINIKVEGISSTSLKSIVAGGRYNIAVEHEGEKVILSTPALGKEIKVRGQVLEDEATFTVYVPQYSEVSVNGETVSTTGSLAPWWGGFRLAD